MLALTLIELCAREYNDVTYQRIKKSGADGDPNWLDWLNDAQRAVVLVRPDANAVVQAMQLTAGTKQALPSGGLRLLGVTRNMGSGGSTPGRTIRFIERESLDDLAPSWHAATGASPTKEVVYDEKKAPTTFYVNPPAPGTSWYIEVELSKVPTDVTDPDAGNISLADIYAGPMQAWMLHRAYALATQAVNQFQRSQFYFGSFFQQLGVKLRAEMFMGAFTNGQFPRTATNG